MSVFKPGLFKGKVAIVTGNICIFVGEVPFNQKWDVDNTHKKLTFYQRKSFAFNLVS